MGGLARPSLADGKGGSLIHAQIVNFRLKDMTLEQFKLAMPELAPAFAKLPGLLAKIWVGDAKANAYGAILLWQDRKSMENYNGSELFRSVKTHPNFQDVTAKDYPVIDELTKLTQPALQVIGERQLA